MGTPRIVNSGKFEKTVGTGTEEVEPPFENLGTIKVETGKVEFKKPRVAELSTQLGWREPIVAGAAAPGMR